MGGNRKIGSKKPTADVEYVQTHAEQRIERVGGKCSLCPPHSGCNQNRKRPRPDKGKNKRRG